MVKFIETAEASAPAARLLSSHQNYLAGNWPEIAPNMPFLPDIPVRKFLKPTVRLPWTPWHGRGRRFNPDQVHHRSPYFRHHLRSFAWLQDFGSRLSLRARLLEVSSSIPTK